MKKKNTLKLLALVSTLFLYLVLTNPNQVSLPLILVPFVLLGFIIFLLFKTGLGFFFHESANKGKMTLLAMIVSVIIVNISLLRSIGQLTFQDAAISLLITVVAIIYISKFQFKQ